MNKTAYKIVGAMSKDLCCEICAHFGIDSVENLVANRRNRFINRYGERDNNYLRICQSVTVTDQCSIDTATHNSVCTIVFSACEILYDNALYKFTLHYITNWPTCFVAWRLIHFVSLYFYRACLTSVCCMYSLIFRYRIRCLSC